MSSSSVVSGISALPSAAGARHRHGTVKQLKIKATQPQQQQLLHGRYRQSRGSGSAVVVKAGPGGLSEIEPDLNEDPVDRWATPGISPVRSFSQFTRFWILYLLSELSEEMDKPWFMG